MASLESPKSLSIFDLLDYIVNEPPPTLPRGLLDDDFTDFVDRCLKKLPAERESLAGLSDHAWIAKSVETTTNALFAEWVKTVITNPTSLIPKTD